MRDFLVRRLITLPIVLVGVTVVLFVVSQLIPADPVRMIVGDTVTPELRAIIEARLGLDKPLPEQYLRYVGRLASADLGTSIRYNLPVTEMIAQAFPATLTLVIGGGVLAVLIAVPIGLLSAVKRNTPLDAILRSFAAVAMSAPPFFTAIVFILLLSFHLGWFPISGRGDPPDLWHLALPALVLALRYSGNTARLLRSSMIESLSEDYIRAARARGLPERTINRYALRPALIPAVTDLGVSLADMVGSVILIETVFAWPGIGRLVQIAIQWNDFPLLTGCVLTLVLYAFVVNIMIDLTYSIIDPRVRVS